MCGGVCVSECSEEGRGQDESYALGRLVWQCLKDRRQAGVKAGGVGTYPN